MQQVVSLYTPPVELPTLTISPSAEMTVRRGSVNDVPRLYELINYYAMQNVMLPRTMDNLYNRVREFQVVQADQEVVACAGLKIIWRNLAEIVSTVVHPDFQGHSLTRRLVDALMDDAMSLNIQTVCALTLQPVWLSRLGFREVPRYLLHHKIWQDCHMCVKQDYCDEVAMIRKVREGASANEHCHLYE
jgi:amino-acid N-acetyltransferase